MIQVRTSLPKYFEETVKRASSKTLITKVEKKLALVLYVSPKTNSSQRGGNVELLVNSKY